MESRLRRSGSAVRHAAGVLALAAAVAWCAGTAAAAPTPPPAGLSCRLKDIARVDGASPGTVIGYGLVVGLDGSGDGRGALFTIQSVANLLQNLGLTIDSRQVKVKNVAAVMVTAEIPAFARPGSTVDVTVSSLGDASSLQGGTLLLTPLVGRDGVTIGTAQGAVSIGGYNVQTGGGTSSRKNHATVGRISGGGTIELASASEAPADSIIGLVLREPDAATASRAAEAVDARFGEGVAHAVDPMLVRIEVPAEYRRPGGSVAFLAQIEDLVVPVDVEARVVVNEKTGTIVIGSGVRILPIAISHGSLSIKIRSTPVVSQPEGFGPIGSSTVVVTHDDVHASEEGGELAVLEAGSSVAELAQALNALGVMPRDMIAILQAMRSAGALQAELVIQ